MQAISNKHDWYAALVFEPCHSRHKPPPPLFVPAAEVDAEMRLHVCELCPNHAQRSCKTAAALAVHKARTHSIHRPEKVYLGDLGLLKSDGTFKPFTCPVCKKMFRQLDKAVAHITMTKVGATSCAEELNLRGDVG
jgi:protein-arginine kinase activator protein McsA